MKGRHSRAKKQGDSPLTEEEQREIDAMWKDHRRIQAEEEQQAWEEYRKMTEPKETCACGYDLDRFGCVDSSCETPGCGCPEPHEVNVGDGPGGFKIYE